METGLRHRIEGSGNVVVELSAGEEVMAEAGRVLFRRGGVEWAAAGNGRSWLGKVVNGIQRRAAGLPARMSRYRGPGEVGFGIGAAGVVRPVELSAGSNVLVQAGSVLAVSAGVVADVALVRRIRGRDGGTLAMERLTGSGVALLGALGEAVEVELAAGERLEAAWWAIAWYDATAEFEVVVRGGRSRTHFAAITGPGRVTLQVHRAASG